MDGAFKLPDIDANGVEILPSPLQHYAQSDRWYQNMGNGQFQLQEITRESRNPDPHSAWSSPISTGIDTTRSSLAMMPGRITFWSTSGDNHFVNAADAKGIANGIHGCANGCMGIHAGDFNRDGTTRFAHHQFQAGTF